MAEASTAEGSEPVVNKNKRFRKEKRVSASKFGGLTKVSD